MRFLSLVCLLGATLSIGCGSNETAVVVGERSISRLSFLEWAADRTNSELDGRLDMKVVHEAITEWITNESLTDLLAEYGVSVSKQDRITARDFLIANGMKSDDSRFSVYTEWQAVRTIISKGGQAVRSAYEKNIELFGYELCTSHILLDSQFMANQVQNSIKEGKSFALIARSLSQDPGSAVLGGDLGCVTVGSFVAPYERAVLGALQAGANLVGPVPSQFGFHIIRINEVRKVEPLLFDELGDRTFGAIRQIATLTRRISVDNRYGSWDPVIGAVVPPDEV